MENEILKPHFELAPGLTSEEMQALFFNQDALVEAPEKIYRINTKGARYYYKFNEDQEPEFFVSVTTLIKQTTPTSEYLIKWIAEMGYEEAKQYAAERASYGTFMHKEIAWLLINRSYDLDDLKPRLKQYIEEEQLASDSIYWEDDLKQDLLAFAQFMIDHNVKPIAIEIVLSHPSDGYAGAVDLVCIMDDEEKGFFGEIYKSGPRKDEPKETKRIKNIVAMIDFKSGRKGFFEDAEIQLGAYKEMWQIHFPSKPIEKIFNWSPKNWRSKPSFNLKDQTGSKNLQKLPHLIELAKIEDGKRDKSVVLSSGVIDIEKGISDNYSTMQLSELVKEKGKDLPEKSNDLLDEHGHEAEEFKL